jgi:hypothetical protein
MVDEVVGWCNQRRIIQSNTSNDFAVARQNGAKNSKTQERQRATVQHFF